MRLKAVLLLIIYAPVSTVAAELNVSVKQITFGPKHHFFGYIGHVRTIPWNGSGRYIVGLRTRFQDHMPKADEPAEVILVDTENNYQVRAVDRTLAWNFQQGTMLYWNPADPEHQFFFNDRDPKTGKVFCVLFDISKGSKGGTRVREFRFEDTPVGNGGVAQNGNYFLGLNYARLARLRPVTGYPDTFDWTIGVKHPADDGVFRVDVKTGEKQLIVSYRQLRDAVRGTHPQVEDTPLFINHTLSNRDSDRIYFYARGNFGNRVRRINVPFCVDSDGSRLQAQTYIGGHPEWELGRRMIGSHDGRQVIYDTTTRKIVDQIGTPELIPSPGGDIALSPDAKWFVNGYRSKGKNYYVAVRRADGKSVRTRAFDLNGWTSGPLRLDPAPCWNRDSSQILIPAIAGDKERTRQMFLITLKK